MSRDKRWLLLSLFIVDFHLVCCCLAHCVLKRRLEPPLVETYLNIQREQQAIPFATISQ